MHWIYILETTKRLNGDNMSVKRDGFFANIFDAYKQTIIMIGMLIAYLIIYS